MLERVRNARLWRTLRFRLAAWNAAVVVVTALVTLIGLRQGVRWALIHELDQLLMDDARELAARLANVQGSDLARLQLELTRRAEVHEREGWYVKLVDRQGRIHWSSPKAPATPPLLGKTSQLEPITFQNSRVVANAIEHSVPGFDRVVVGASLNLIQQDLSRIDRWVLLAAGAVLLAAPLCGYWLAARAARTMGVIITSASRLRPSHLNERLPIQGSGDELDQLAHTINSLLDRIAAYLNVKRDFLANAAHELRTPLAAIRSTMEVALNSNRSTEEYEELMVDVIEECFILETLVNQLLLLSETEADLPAAKFEPVALDALTAKSIEMFTGVAEGRGVCLRTGELASAVVRGNPAHLRQLLNNLIDNAVKYTPAGGKVMVNLHLHNASRQVELCVADTGQGISSEEQRHIFERFYRAESARTRAGGPKGAGLGLSICQSVVNNHGGTIACASEPDGGTTFTVLLPSDDGGQAHAS